MRPKPRRKWTPRVLAIYLVVTVFGGVILFLFLLLVGLLYWMNARVPLPPTERLIPSDATAYLVVRADRIPAEERPSPRGMAELLSRGTLRPVRRLVEKGLNDPGCAAQIVASLVKGSAGRESALTIAVSLGRYPGTFWMIRHDLERRCNRQKWSASVRYHRGKAVFISKESGKPGLNTLSLAGCTLLRGSDGTRVDELIDQLVEETSPSGKWPAPGTLETETSATVRFFGWTDIFLQTPPLASVVTGETLNDLEGFRKALGAELPAITRARDFRFSGGWEPSTGTEVHVTFQPDAQDDAEATAKWLADWLRRDEVTLKIESPKVRAQGGRVEVTFRTRPSDGELR